MRWCRRAGAPNAGTPQAGTPSAGDGDCFRPRRRSQRTVQSRPRRPAQPRHLAEASPSGPTAARLEPRSASPAAPPHSSRVAGPQPPPRRRGSAQPPDSRRVTLAASPPWPSRAAGPRPRLPEASPFRPQDPSEPRVVQATPRPASPETAPPLPSSRVADHQPIAPLSRRSSPSPSRHTAPMSEDNHLSGRIWIAMCSPSCVRSYSTYPATLSAGRYREAISHVSS